MQHTKNFNLNKPEGTDYADIEKLNENFEKIDEKLKEMDNKTQEATENEKGILTKNQVKDLAKEALPFGVGNDDVLQGTMLAKIMGLPDEGYKGLITETGEKKQGYAYYDPGTHQMYYCKKTNNQNYVDNNNFASFSNKSLLDQLENLFETHWINLGNNTPVGKVFETQIKVPSKPYKLFYSVFTGGSKFIDLKVAPQYATSEIVVNLGVSNTGFLQYSIAKNTSVIDARHICVMFIF